MSEKLNETDRSKNDSSAAQPVDEERKPRIDWEDPTIPIGNGPPLPRWPLAVSGIAWLLWIVLMLVMALTRDAAAGVG